MCADHTNGFSQGIKIWMWRFVYTAIDPGTVNVSELHYVLKSYDQHNEQWLTKTQDDIHMH